MKKQSSLTEILHIFIYYKIFESIISIIILITTYKLFPKPFKFFYNIILQNLK